MLNNVTHNINVCVYVLQVLEKQLEDRKSKVQKEEKTARWAELLLFFSQHFFCIVRMVDTLLAFTGKAMSISIICDDYGKSFTIVKLAWIQEV